MELRRTIWSFMENIKQNFQMNSGRKIKDRPDGKLVLGNSHQSNSGRRRERRRSSVGLGSGNGKIE